MSEKQSKELAPRPSFAVGARGIVLDSFENLQRFAAMCVASGAAPKGMSKEAAAIAIQAGLERGLSPLGGLQHCTVINGNLSWKGQGAFALIANSGLCEPGTLRMWHEGDGEGMKGVAVAHRVGYAKPERREFTIADAKRAGLYPASDARSPWKRYPERMLMWRAMGFLARDLFPDVLGGFPLEHEALEYEPREPARRAEGPPKAELPEGGGSADPLLDALGGGDVVIENEAEPAASIQINTGEKPGLNPGETPATELEPEDTCEHGIVLSESCLACDAAEVKTCPKCDELIEDGEHQCEGGA